MYATTHPRRDVYTVYMPNYDGDPSGASDLVIAKNGVNFTTLPVMGVPRINSELKSADVARLREIRENLQVEMNAE